MDWSKLIRKEIDPMTPYRPGLRESEVRVRCAVDSIRKLSSNENPYPPFPSAITAMQDSLAGLNRYPDGSSGELVEALSAFYGLDARNIVVGNGSNELLCLIGQVILEPGDEIVYAWPSFVVYPMMAQISGATAVPVPLRGDFVHDLGAMLDAITDATKIVILCNPNNPTGTIYTREAFTSFMENVPDHVVVVIDEAYFEYVTAPEFPDAQNWFDGKRPLVVLRTFSKIYSLAGVRCGYGFMPEPLAVALSKAREPFNVNSVAQASAVASLADQGEVARRREEAACERGILEDTFKQLGLPYCPSQTNFVWVNVKDDTQAFDELLKRGIIVRSFGTGSFLRVGVGCPDDTTCTCDAFCELADAGLL